MSGATRRVFLVTLAGGGAGLAFVRLRGKDEETVVLELRDVLERNEGTDLIGAWYLKRAPEENDIQVLGERLISELGWDRYLAPNISRMIRGRVRKDFEEDKILRLGFWRLSLTEVRLCALSFLAAGAPAPTRPLPEELNG